MTDAESRSESVVRHLDFFQMQMPEMALIMIVLMKLLHILSHHGEHV